MIIPQFQSLINPQQANQELATAQQQVLSNKSEHDINGLQQTFRIVIQNLLSEHNAASNSFMQMARQMSAEGKSYPEIPETRLNNTLDIWNSLILHRRLNCTDGTNSTASIGGETPYPIIQMSDGEKVLLYLIAQILQAPKDGFIVIDEPEMYLHKTILKKLWDRLEQERQDCIFIYLLMI